MMRRFHIQLVPRGYVRQSAEEMEAEALRLDGIAMLIDIMLGRVNLEACGERNDPWTCKTASVRHDEANFHCFVGPEHQKARIVIKRGASALLWSEAERMAFAALIANGYREKNGGLVHAPDEVRMLMYEYSVREKCPPLFDDDGNRPRPEEETSPAAGDVRHVSRRR